MFGYTMANHALLFACGMSLHIGKNSIDNLLLDGIYGLCNCGLTRYNSHTILSWTHSDANNANRKS